MEYHGGNQAMAFAAIAEKIGPNITEVLTRARDQGVLPRDAALDIARERVLTAMSFR